jgi:hypothetical protein
MPAHLNASSDESTNSPMAIVGARAVLVGRDKTKPPSMPVAAIFHSTRKTTAPISRIGRGARPSGLVGIPQQTTVILRSEVDAVDGIRFARTKGCGAVQFLVSKRADLGSRFDEFTISMTTEKELREKLRKISALFEGATTIGERHAAAAAIDRVRKALAVASQTEQPVETQFTLSDQWSRRLFTALCRRYGLAPYRYRRQRHITHLHKKSVPRMKGTGWGQRLAPPG